MLLKVFFVLFSVFRAVGLPIPELVNSTDECVLQEDLDNGTWEIRDVHPGLYNIYVSQKDKLDQCFPNLFSGRIRKFEQKEITDTMYYNWNIDTLYSYNEMNALSPERSRSEIWTSKSSLANYFRGGMRVTTEFKTTPSHHKTEFVECLKEWDTRRFRNLFEIDSIPEIRIYPGPDYSQYFFARIIIREGKVFDIQTMSLKAMKWEIKKPGCFYD